VITLAELKIKRRMAAGGAATLPDVRLDPAMELKSLTVRSVAKER
jgi:hypothetical protein